MQKCRYPPRRCNPGVHFIRNSGGTISRKKNRDIEKRYTARQVAAKLRRLADCLEQGRAFTIQIAGERIYLPAGTSFSIEHEREGNFEEVEFQFRWENN